MTTSPMQRERLAQAMDYLYAHAGKVHYPSHDVRTEQIHGIASMAELRDAVQGPHGLTMDCSQSVELLCHVAGISDPDGYDYRKDGYTGTLLATLPHYHTPGGANVGAIVIFGPGTGEHAAMVRHPGHDPILFSHGQEAGPFYLPLSQERVFHSPPVTFLSIADLG